jgi:hypothetical protein
MYAETLKKHIMPPAIRLQDFTCDPCFCGRTWTIYDQNELALIVAMLVAGRYRHALSIIRRKPISEITLDERTSQILVQSLNPQSEPERYHRDGHIFQMMSWIAAHHAASSSTIISQPHVIRAHKGFDGIQLDIAADERASSITIFEDKATINPRETVRDDVWPEIRKLENGERRHIIAQEVTVLLERGKTEINIDATVESLLWNAKQCYRVSVTADNRYAEDEGRRRLFAGYEEVVDGTDLTRRRAELIYLNGVREWMNEFSLVVAQCIRKII